MEYKIYVEVLARYTVEGQILPEQIVWRDGRRFVIDRIRDIRPAASLKAGGAGIRYACVIGGRERFLFLEENRWFVENKEV